MKKSLLCAGAVAMLTGATWLNAAEIEIEAESATLKEPMVVVEDAASSGGKHIMSKKNGKGTAVIEFEVPEDGTYVIWALCKGLGGNKDSFFFGVDADAKMIFDTASPKELKWRKMTDRESKQNKFELKKGKHKLTLKSREAEAQLDKVIIAKPGFKPAKK